MTNLLISVKNVAEALIALDAGVDMIDLKDPNVGALGALELNISQQIVQKIHQFKALSINQTLPLISTTVGESHANAQSLIKAIDVRIKLGVDIIKIAVSDLCRNHVLIKLADQAQHVKLVAVFFADEAIDFTLLDQLKVHGFYGAMIDTQQKQQNLLEICSLTTLQAFVKKCEKIGLKTGVAGSLKPQHIEYLAVIHPSYIGFRGGVCVDSLRNSTLEIEKIIHVKKLLQEHNKFNDLAHFELSLALHSQNSLSIVR